MSAPRPAHPAPAEPPRDEPTALLLWAWEDILDGLVAEKGDAAVRVVAAVKSHLRRRHLIDVLGNPTKEARAIRAQL